MSYLRPLCAGDREGTLVIVIEEDGELTETHLRRDYVEGEGACVHDRPGQLPAERVRIGPRLAFPAAAGDEELLEASARARVGALYAVKHLVNQELAQAINVLDAVSLEDVSLEKVSLEEAEPAPEPAPATGPSAFELLASTALEAAGRVRAKLESRVRHLEDEVEATRRRADGAEARATRRHRMTIRGVDDEDISTGGE